MAYHFESFGGLLLPIYNVQTDQSGGVAASTLVRTINGTIDTRGSRRVVPDRGTFTMRAVIADESVASVTAEYWLTGTGDRVVISGTDAFVFVAAATGVVNTIRQQLDALRALIGTMATLVRVPNTGSGNQSVTARLMAVRAQTMVGQHRAWQEVDLTFESASPYWHGTQRTANRSGTTISAANSGNAPVRDAILTVTGAIASSVTVTGPGISFTWTGTLAAGLQLIVSGNTVTANGASSRVTLGANHTRDVLIELEPGTSALTVTGGASAKLDWYDAWQ